VTGRRRPFGGVDRLPSGLWRARYRDGGGRRVTAPRTFSTKADANAFLATVQTDLLRGHYVDARAGRVTVAKWADIWLERPGKRAATVARDRQAIAVFRPVRLVTWP
jgi:hypothetical protein